MALNRLHFNLLLILLVIFLTSFISAWLEIFYPPLILIITLLISAGLFYWLYFKKKPIQPKRTASIHKLELFTLVFLAIYCLFLFLNFNPIYLEGRDPGAMLEGAVMLAKNHELKFEPAAFKIFNNQGADQLALNYPGFIITNDGQLKTQFNIGFVSWQAFWWGLWGETGLKLAIIFPLLLGFLSVFLIVKTAAKNQALALMTLPLLALAFPFFWQARQNYSETLAFCFLFSGILALVKINQNLKNQTKLKIKNNKQDPVWKPNLIVQLQLVLFTFFSFSLIRSEGIFISLLALIILASLLKKHFEFKNPPKTVALTFLILVFIFIAYSFSILPFYKKMVKDLIGYKNQQFETPAFSFSSLNNLFLTSSYLTRVAITYSLAWIVSLGLIQCFIKLGQLIKQKKHRLALLFTPFNLLLILSGPFLIYLIKPMITLDHPWLLRRFMFAVLPLLTISTVLFLYRFKNKLLSVSLVALLTAFLIPNFIRYGFIKENPQLLTDLSSLAKQFQDNDLILVDKSTTPNDWSLISAPLRYLFDKNAVYIYNPADINKIGDEFNNVYLLVDQENVSNYQTFIDSTSAPKTTILNFYQLDIQTFNKSRDLVRPVNLPTPVTLEKKVYIYKINNIR